jgi:phage regulator Rha-like protein
MSKLTVENKNEILVVDSRLVAEELGIEHKTLKSTITKYLAKLVELGTLDI